MRNFPRGVSFPLEVRSFHRAGGPPVSKEEQDDQVASDSEIIATQDEEIDRTGAGPGWLRGVFRRPHLLQKLAQGRRALVKRLALIIGGLLLLPYLITLVYAVVPPPASALMLIRLVQGVIPHYDWVPMDEISPHLARAVISSEDQRFCMHSGIDWVAVSRVIEDDESRGASTITMQTAKNLFLWPGRSYLRKALEVPLALWIDLIWSKRRVMEVYLNIAEFGRGVYGAEEAARRHFGKRAKDLTRREAALLAAVLPNPLVRSAGKPGRLTNRITNLIQRRMAGIGPYAVCVN